MKSIFLQLNKKDFINGLIMAVLGAIVGGLYSLFQPDAVISWSWATFAPILKMAGSAAVAYFIKNFFSNSEGQFLKTEKYAQASRAVKRNNKAKSYIMLILLLSIPMFINAQSNLFKPVSKSIFTVRQVDGNGLLSYQNSSEKGKWIPRFNTGVMGVSYELKKGSQPVPFSAIGFGLGYYYFENINGEPFNVWGVNALILSNTENPAIGFGLYGSYNTNAVGLLNIGSHYDFSSNKFFIDSGLTFKF